jgi:hypothetical protein
MISNAGSPTQTYSEISRVNVHTCGILLLHFPDCGAFLYDHI